MQLRIQEMLSLKVVHLKVLRRFHFHHSILPPVQIIMSNKVNQSTQTTETFLDRQVNSEKPRNVVYREYDAKTKKIIIEEISKNIPSEEENKKRDKIREILTKLEFANTKKDTTEETSKNLTSEDENKEKNKIMEAWRKLRITTTKKDTTEETSKNLPSEDENKEKNKVMEGLKKLRIPNKKEVKTEESSKNIPSEEENKKNKSIEILKKVGLFTAITAGVSVATIGGVAIAVPAIGFGAAGVTAGSLAAAYQSAFLGGAIASGSAFATLQSVGAAGLALSTQVGIVAGSATLAGTVTAAKELFKKKKGKTDSSPENNEKDVNDETGLKQHMSTQTDCSLRKNP